MKKTQCAADLRGKCYDYRFVLIPRGHSEMYTKEDNMRSLLQVLSNSASC